MSSSAQMVQLLEVVRRVELASFPVEPEPVHVLAGSRRRTRRPPSSGFVSSNRRLHVPPNSSATPKFRQIDFAWPMCRYPLGSGGKRVCTRPPCLPVFRSSATMVRMKSSGLPDSGAAPAPGPVSVVIRPFYPHEHRFRRPRHDFRPERIESSAPPALLWIDTLFKRNHHERHAQRSSVHPRCERPGPGLPAAATLPPPSRAFPRPLPGSIPSLRSPTPSTPSSRTSTRGRWRSITTSITRPTSPT